MRQNSHPTLVNPYFICSGFAIVSYVSGLECLMNYITYLDQWWSLESHAEGWARWVVSVSGLGRPHGTLCMRPLPSSVWTSAGSPVWFPLHSAAPPSTVTQQQQQQHWTTWARTLTAEVLGLPEHADFSFHLHPIPTPLLPTPADPWIKSLWHATFKSTHYTQFRILWDNGDGPCQCTCMMMLQNNKTHVSLSNLPPHYVGLICCFCFITTVWDRKYTELSMLGKYMMHKCRFCTLSTFVIKFTKLNFHQ